MKFEYQKPSSIKLHKSDLSEKWIQKMILVSFVFCMAVFAIVKTAFITKQKQASVVSTSISESKLKTFSLQPLIVNLKNKQKPELTHIQIHITTNKEAVKKELASKNALLQKQLLLILSGQDIKKIKKNKNNFEKRFVTQLNAFLSKGKIQNARIELVQ